MCRVCGCYRGGIVVMDVFWRRHSVLSWARVRQVRRGSLSSELLMCGGGVRIILLLPQQWGSDLPQDNPLHHSSHSPHLEAFPYILHTISIRHNIPGTIFHTAHADDISSLPSYLSSNPEAVLLTRFTLKISSELL